MIDLFSDLQVLPTMDEPPPPNGGGGPPVIALSIPDDDMPPEPLGPTCDVCGVEIEWSGRGRKPKYCIDHRRRTNTPREKVQPSTDDSDKARLQAIADDLIQGAGELAGTLAPFAPVTAVTVGMQSPSAIAALIRIGEKYPRFLNGLEAVSKTVPMVTVARFMGAVLLAMLVDAQRLKPYGVAAEMLGVSAAAQEAGYIDPDTQVGVVQQQQMKVDKTMPPPPAFKGF